VCVCVCVCVCVYVCVCTMNSFVLSIFKNVFGFVQNYERVHTQHTQYASHLEDLCVSNCPKLL
jgi:hypothetical protein